VKDQQGVVLYPASVATRLRKVVEKYVVECGIPVDELKVFSPYYLYELSTATDVTRKNVRDWLKRASETPRQDLLAQVRAVEENRGNKEPTAMIRVPESVYARIQEAQQHLSVSVKANVSTTTFLEFMTEIVLNTQGQQLRKLWDVVHGESVE